MGDLYKAARELEREEEAARARQGRCDFPSCSISEEHPRIVGNTIAKEPPTPGERIRAEYPTVHLTRRESALIAAGLRTASQEWFRAASAMEGGWHREEMVERAHEALNLAGYMEEQ